MEWRHWRAPCHRILYPASPKSLRGKHRSRARVARDDLVEYEQHVVAVANIAQDMKIFFRRRNNTACVADGFDYDAGNGIRVFADYDVFEKLRAKAIAFFPEEKRSR